MANRRKRVLHISETNTLEKPFLKQKFEYRHFSYITWYNSDQLIEMWQRVAVMMVNYKPDIILLQFVHENCINENERSFLESFGVVIDIK